MALVMIKYVNDIEVCRAEVLDINVAAHYIMEQIEMFEMGDLILEESIYRAPNGDTVRLAFSQESGMAILREALTEEG